MGSLSDYLENALLDHIFPTASSFTRPTNIFCALYTATPGDSGGGTELSGSGYARATADSWDVASGGSTSNGAEITFPTSTANWNTLTAFGLFDTSTGGNLLAWGTITNYPIANIGDIVRFSTGTITITFD